MTSLFFSRNSNRGVSPGQISIRSRFGSGVLLGRSFPDVCSFAFILSAADCIAWGGEVAWLQSSAAVSDSLAATSTRWLRGLTLKRASEHVSDIFGLACRPLRVDSFQRWGNAMRLILMLFASMVLSSAAHAQNPASVRSPEQLPSAPAQHERMRNLTETYQRGDQGNTQQTAALKNQCMAVIAVDPYCACLQSKLPNSMGFDSYVTILSRSKEENKYSRLNADAKKVYDAIPKVSEFCEGKLAVAN